MMKPLFTLCFTLIVLFSSAQYKVTLHAPQYTEGMAYLTYHMGKNLNVQDSGMVDKNGTVIFKGDKSVPGGIYSIVFPGKRLTADFFIDKDQQITIKADTTKLMNMEVTGSKENDLFKEYQAFIAERGALLQKARRDYTSATNQADSAKHEETYKRYNKEITDFRNNIIEKHPESMMAVMLNAMKEPPYPTKVPVTKEDSIENYQYYKSHYWDGITFMDDRVLRTPFFIPKMERYYREIMPQAADSIIKDIDYKLLLARSAPEIYKYMLNWLTDEYINPKYMGQDAIFVHLFNKYHSKGLSPWLNEKQMEVITRRAYMQMSNLIGEQAANLEMVDSTGRLTPLYGLKSDYTVVIFWDPNCGHCKQEMPKIDSVYQASWKQNGVKIYAMLTEPHKPEWVKYIKEKNLGDWTHVYQTDKMEEAEKGSQKPSYRQLYDVTQTPILYLLDKDKRIIGKKLTWEQINELLQVKWKTAKK